MMYELFICFVLMNTVVYCINPIVSAQNMATHNDTSSIKRQVSQQ